MTKSQIANGILVATLAYNYYVTRKNKKKYNEILEKNHLLQYQLYYSVNAIDYLSNKLDEHEIPMTEFDLFAMSHPM